MESFHFQIETSHLQGKSARRLDHVLSELTSHSRSFLQQHIQKGHVRLNGTPAEKAGQVVRDGDEIEGRFEALADKNSLEPIAADLAIVFEDTDLLVINKPQGLVVHPAPSHEGATLVHHLLHHLGTDAPEDTERPGIVHRLDKGTSGLLLVAKNRKAQERLSDEFKSRKVHKQYEALVWGKHAGQGRYQSRIGRDPVHRTKMSSRTRAGRDAITDWKAIETYSHFTWVRLFPLTGRTHQLRVHLSEDGHPIVGDPLYGRGLTTGRKANLNPQIISFVQETEATFLHAAHLEFNHPSSGQKMAFTAERPERFNQMLALLKELDR